MRIEKAIMSVRKNLSDDLLKPVYRKLIDRKPTTGHCYVASEAIYHLLEKNDKKNYKPHYVKIGKETHWFLMTDDKNNIVDPTYDQFDFWPDYDNGKRAAFLTKKPSKRTSILLKRILNGSRVRTKKS